jgi:hypothetical protein
MDDGDDPAAGVISTAIALSCSEAVQSSPRGPHLRPARNLGTLRLAAHIRCGGTVHPRVSACTRGSISFPSASTTAQHPWRNRRNLP